MSKLFDDDDLHETLDIKTNTEYASAYNTWRQKEELNKLKTKYGEHIKLNDTDGSEEESSSSEEEDFIEEFEKDFFKTLSCLKNKDPCIYDENVVFFKQQESESNTKREKIKKQEPLYMKDYERKIILEKDGKFEESDDEITEDPRCESPTYVEEQKRIKESFKKILEDGEDDDWGGLFQKRTKSKDEEKKEEEDYKQWLLGQKNDIEDETIKSELKPLKEYWSNPNLDKKEAFLRDYLLNKRYLEKEDGSYIPSYDEIIHDSDEDLSADEQAIEEQEQFEHKYNFRFEEPDQDFIKRYPRTMDNSLRRKDDRRKIKREELRKRKEDDKKQKQEELKQLKSFKRKEIEEKISKLKEITGNDDMTFQVEDLEEDFDPEAYDRRMKALFDDKYYEGDEGDQKPEYPEFEEELGEWNTKNELHCEDDNFIMDCDYDPNVEKKTKEEKKKRRLHKSKQENEEFDGNDEKYQEYMDELYQLDYEDMIGDIPCRFRYREVIPNDFGLTIEEILMANDKELNHWCSLKKAVQHRPDYMEKYDLKAYKIKASNEKLKQKLLPSLYVDINEEEFRSDPSENKSTKNKSYDEPKQKIETQQPNKKCSDRENSQSKGNINNVQIKNRKHIKDDFLINETEKANQSTKNDEKINRPKKSKKRKHTGDESGNISLKTPTDSKNNGEQLMNRNLKKHKKIKLSKENDVDATNVSSNLTQHNTGNEKAPSTNKLSKRQKKNKKKQMKKPNEASLKTPDSKQQKVKHKTKVKNHKKYDAKENFVSENGVKISDARLAAYGINPKRYKNKLKYKGK